MTNEIPTRTNEFILYECKLTNIYLMRTSFLIIFFVYRLPWILGSVRCPETEILRRATRWSYYVIVRSQSLQAQPVRPYFEWSIERGSNPNLGSQNSGCGYPADAFGFNFHGSWMPGVSSKLCLTWSGNLWKFARDWGNLFYFLGGRAEIRGGN